MNLKSYIEHFDTQKGRSICHETDCGFYGEIVCISNGNKGLIKVTQVNARSGSRHAWSFKLAISGRPSARQARFIPQLVRMILAVSDRAHLGYCTSIKQCLL